MTRSMMNFKCLPLLAALSAALPAIAAGMDFQRPLAPDRPDTTEGPTTLERGGIQVETGLWNYSRDFSDGLERQTWSVGETNIKFGIADDQDLQFVLRPYLFESFKGEGGGDAEGFGDIDIRWKKNLWGNDGGKTAAALMPFVTVPTQTAVSAGEWQGGLIFVFSTELPAGWDLGAQVELDRMWDDDSSRHEWDFFHSVVFGHDLGESTGVYLEYFGTSGGHAYQANLSAGLTWNVGKNLQFDLGGVLGLNDAAEDYSLFQGFTIRF